MSVKQHLVTAGELRDMPGIPGKRLELVDGEVIEVPGGGAVHMMIAGMLYKLLDDFVRQHNLGVVMPDGLSYVLRQHPDLVRIPAVSFITSRNVPASGLPEGFREGPPTLAVEVVSPGNRADELHDRVQDYLETGTRQVWVLWPRRQSISVYRPDQDTRELGSDAMLAAGEILPEFSVRVGDLFDVHRS